MACIGNFLKFLFGMDLSMCNNDVENKFFRIFRFVLFLNISFVLARCFLFPTINEFQCFLFLKDGCGWWSVNIVIFSLFLGHT
jgi:hypothetical protein